MTTYLKLAEEFKDIAFKKYEYWLEKYGKYPIGAIPVPEDFVEKVLADLEGDETVKGIYDVYDAGMEGLGHDTMTFVKADSEKHARLLVAIERRNTEIYETGFYGATLIKRKIIEKKIIDLEKELETLKKVL
jgi:hypothetical protein